MVRVAPRESAHQAKAVDTREAVHTLDHAPARTRRRRATVSEDKFYIPLDEIPEGSSYEWKRWSVSGQHDPFYIAEMRQQGWEPVSPKTHPNWVPPGYNEPHILKEGMILMERPMELTEEARRELRQLSKTQVKEAEQRLGMTPKVNGVDTGTRELAEVAPSVQKEYFRPVQVED